MVYHQMGIALPIPSMRATCEILLSESLSPSRILAPDLGLELDISVAKAQTGGLEHALVTTVKQAQQQIGLSDCPSLSISSSIPIKRGLGSGSAISAAIFKALAAYAKYAYTTAELYDFVQAIEAIYHGQPSGIDAQVVAYERALIFKRGQAPQFFQLPAGFELLVIDTGPAAPTHEVVNWVATQMQRDPERYQALMQQIGAVSQEIFTVLKAISQLDKTASAKRIEMLQLLGKQLNQNQLFLHAMGVSSQNQDELLARLIQAGAWGAKLSGAGRGGICLAIGPDLSPLEVICESFQYPNWRVQF